MITERKLTTEENAEKTVMFFREIFIGYFKNDNIERKFANSHVEVYPIMNASTSGRRSFLYERQEAEAKAHLGISIDSTLAMELMHQPDTIVLHDRVIQRSPEFIMLFDGVFAFLKSMLPFIRIESSKDEPRNNMGRDPLDGRKDAKVLESTQLRDLQRNPYNDYEEFVRMQEEMMAQIRPRRSRTSMPYVQFTAGSNSSFGSGVNLTDSSPF